VLFRSSEIGEASEAFEAKKQVGSSTMPQKRNPILCEQVSGLSRVVRSFIIPAYENAVQWHERDLANSSSERFILPHSLILTDWIVFQMNNVFRNLQVYPERMRLNLERSKGLPMAESVMTKLVEKGMGRGEAHELVRTCSMKAVGDDRHLLSVLLESPQVVKVLKRKELEDAMNPRNYLGVTDKIIDQVVKKLTR
jgi:adenylosuccinate lyase